MPRDLDRSLRDGPDETGSVPQEFPQLSEDFASPEERTMPKAPEFTPPVDEFGEGVSTEPEEEARRTRRVNRLSRMQGVRTAILAVVGLVVLTSAVNAENPGQETPLPDVPGVVVTAEPGGSVPGQPASTAAPQAQPTAIPVSEPQQGDPELSVNYALLDGDQVVYSYVVLPGEAGYPVTVYATAVDEAGHASIPENDPEVWEGSRSVVEFSMDATGLEMPITLRLTEVYTRDGQDRSAMVEIPVAFKTPVNIESTLSATPASVGSEVQFYAEVWPGSTFSLDLEIRDFSLAWYDENGAYLGGGVSVWEDALPEIKHDETLGVWYFAYVGPAHTDYAMDSVASFSTVLTVRDTLTGAIYTISPDPAALSKLPPIAVRPTLVEYGTWVSGKEGLYYHFDEDGTGWVYDGTYFGFLSFTGDDEAVQAHYSIVRAGAEAVPTSTDDGSKSWTVYQSAISNETITAFDLDLPEYAGMQASENALKPATLNVDTTYLEYLRGKTVQEAFYGSWGIQEGSKPANAYDFLEVYSEVVYFMEDGTGGFYIVDTKGASYGAEEPLTYVPEQPDEPGFYVIRIEGEPDFTYTAKDNDGSYSYTLANYGSTAAIVIREDGLFLYLNAPFHELTEYFHYYDD